MGNLKKYLKEAMKYNIKVKDFKSPNKIRIRTNVRI